LSTKKFVVYEKIYKIPNYGVKNAQKKASMLILRRGYKAEEINKHPRKLTETLSPWNVSRCWMSVEMVS